MKTLNEIELLCCLGGDPTSQPRRKDEPDRFGLVMPLCWTGADGDSHYLYAASILRTSKAIRRHVDPGVPLLVAGRLVVTDSGQPLLQIVDLRTSHRSLSTFEVPFELGRKRVLSVRGGWARVALRGRAKANAAEQDGRYRGHIGVDVPLKSGSVRHHLPVDTGQPFQAGDSVLLRGHYVCPAGADATEGVIRAAGEIETGRPVNPNAVAEEDG